MGKDTYNRMVFPEPAARNCQSVAYLSDHQKTYETHLTIDMSSSKGSNP
jgi:hypothetical protein